MFHSLLRTVSCATLLIASVATTHLFAAQQEADWLGGPGDWTDPTKWSTGSAPDNLGLDTYRVFIDHGLAAFSPVTLNAGVTIDALSIDADDSLEILSGASLALDATANVATLENHGLLSLSTGAFTVLEGSLVLSGHGNLSLSDSPGNAINGAGSAPVFINQDNAIAGAGAIGQDSLAIVNQGVISATKPTPLVIDPNASGVINSGVLEAREGGHLTLTGGSFVNSEGGQDGTIRADNSLVEITHPTTNVVSVTGGDIRVEGAGELRLTRATITGSDVQNSPTGIIRVAGMARSNIYGSLNNPEGGRVVIDDRSTLATDATGTYVNDGEILINALTGTTSLALGSPTTISGTGKIAMGPHTGARISGSFINEGNTIEGVGSIFIGFVTNRGIIRANQATLQLDLSSLDLTNSGLVEAVNGGSARLPNFTMINSEGGIEGTIRAGSGGKAILRNVTGGNVEALDGGIIETQGTHSGVKLHIYDAGVVATTSVWETKDATQVTIDPGGRVDVVNPGWTMYGPATHMNNGVIKLGSPTAPGYLSFRWPGDINISGVGEIDMSANAGNQIFAWSFANPALTIGQNQTIRGAGTIGLVFDDFNFFNFGTIIADQAVPMTLSINNPLAGSEFDNYGQYIASGSGGLKLDGIRFRSWGDILVLAGSHMDVNAFLTIYEGILVVDGTVNTTSTNADVYPIRTEGGVVSGNGTIDCNVQNGSILEPGSSVGVLTVARKYTHTALGELSIEIGGLIAGTEYDRLAVGGVATLDGTLRVEFVDGYVPNVGDSFTVMTYPSKVGGFSNMILPGAGRGKIVEVAVGETEVVVSIAPKVRPADPLYALEEFLDAFNP